MYTFYSDLDIFVTFDLKPFHLETRIWLSWGLVNQCIAFTTNFRLFIFFWDVTERLWIFSSGVRLSVSAIISIFFFFLARCMHMLLKIFAFFLITLFSWAFRLPRDATTRPGPQNLLYVVTINSNPLLLATFRHNHNMGNNTLPTWWGQPTAFTCIRAEWFSGATEGDVRLHWALSRPLGAAIAAHSRDLLVELCRSTTLSPMFSRVIWWWR